MKINPVFKKEARISARSMKLPLTIMIYNALLALIVVLTILATNDTVYNYDYASLHLIFPYVVCVEFGLISLFVAVITATSISGEREKQTLDVMLTTPVKPFAIVLGKLGSVTLKVMMFVISSIPILSIAFILGGLNWFALLGFLGMMVYLCIYVGSVGLFCSGLVKKSVVAALLTIVIGLGIVAVTVIIYLVVVFFSLSVSSAYYPSTGVGAWPLVLLLNPYSAIVEFVARAMNTGGFYDMWYNDPSVPGIVVQISRFWLVISVALNMGISFLFLKLAAKVVSPVKYKKLHIREKT